MHRVEYQRVLRRLGVLDDGGELERSELDRLPLALPFHGRVVERVAVLREPEIEREADRSLDQALADFGLEIVVIRRITFLVRKLFDPGFRLPFVAPPVRLAVR